MNREKVSAFFSLFTSMGTLICCALPALFVALGMGAVVATATTQIPGLVWISEHKNLVFIVAGVSLGVAGILQHQARYQSCPTDPALAQACTQARKFSRWIYWISVGIFAIGAFFAYGYRL